jgi:hypothetical protein
MALVVTPSTPGMIDNPTTKRCYLLELPAELRLRIYEFAFSDVRYPDGLRANVECRYCGETGGFIIINRPLHWQGKKSLSLRQTCRQIQREASPVFREHVLFRVSIGPYFRSTYEHLRRVDLVPFVKYFSISIVVNRGNGCEIKQLCNLFQHHGRKPLLTTVFCRFNYLWTREERSAKTALLRQDLEAFHKDAAAGDIEKSMCADILDYVKNSPVVR